MVRKIWNRLLFSTTLLRLGGAIILVDIFKASKCQRREEIVPCLMIGTGLLLFHAALVVQNDHPEFL
nr:hypothetical protein CFP56_61366 [Quercus suber]